MTDNRIYREKLVSNRTTLLFVALTAAFALLAVWRVNARGLDVLAWVCLALSAVFMFYVVNYRTLAIGLTPDALTLRFGLFGWRVPLDNVAGCQLDQVPPLIKYGGAGIHFAFVRSRYRASFNFLEYPRVVIALERKVGPVQEISFSTRRPDELLPLIQAAVSAKTDA